MERTNDIAAKGLPAGERGSLSFYYRKLKKSEREAYDEKESYI